MIKLLDETHDNLIALQAEGKIEKSDYDQVIPVIENVLGTHKEVNAYLEVKEIDSVTANALWEEIKADIKFWDNFNKIAVVGDAKWKKMATKAVDFLPGIETKYFEMFEKETALLWVED